MNRVLILLVICLLLFVGAAGAQDGPTPNVQFELPEEGWFGAIAEDGRSAFSNDEDYLFGAEPVPDDVVTCSVGSPFDMPTYDMVHGGDYVLGQVAGVLASYASGVGTNLDIPTLERVPELDASAFTLDLTDALFWVVAVPSFEQKGVVILVTCRGAVEAERDVLIQIMATAELTRPLNETQLAR